MADTIRTIKTDNYKVMSICHLNDKRLSWKAKGLLSVLLSMAEKNTMEELLSLSSDAKRDAGEVLAELEKCGYLSISMHGSEIEYTVYEKPLAKRAVENPESEIPYAEDLPGKQPPIKSNEEELAKLRERLHIKEVAKKSSERFVELVFRELCRRDAEFRQLMTAQAFELVCITAWERQRHDPILLGFSDLINQYLDNVVLGIKSAGGGNELIITNRLEVRDKLVNK